MSEKTKGSLLVLLAAMLWSTGGILLKLVPWNPIMINGFRSLFAFIFICILNRTIKIKINRFVVLSALCISLTTVLFACANKLTTAANAIVLQYTAPIFVLIMSCILKRRLPSLRQAGVVLVAFAGTILFFCDQLDVGHLIGNILAIISGVTFAGVFFFNSMPQSSNDDALRLSCLISFGIFLISTPFIDYFPVKIDAGICAAILILGVVQIGLAYYVFGRGVQRINPVSASLIGLFEALFNPIWVAIFIGELPGMFALIGGVVIILAVIFNILFVPEEATEKT